MREDNQVMVYEDKSDVGIVSLKEKDVKGVVVKNASKFNYRFS